MSDTDQQLAEFRETLTSQLTDDLLNEYMLADDDEKASTAYLFDLIARAYIGVISPTMVVRRKDKTMVSLPSFDMAYNRIVNDIDGIAGRYKDAAFKYAKSKFGFQVASRVCYRPQQPDFVGGELNMWRDPHVLPLNEPPAIFARHLRYLVKADAERKLIVDFLAWAVQHPDERPDFALLMVGEKRTGKSWIGRLMELIFGSINCALLEREDALLDTFNDIFLHKRLVFLHEAAPHKKVDLVDSLKGFITEDHVWINRKYVERTRVPNTAVLMACTNHPNALKIARDEPRWGVIRCADDMYGVDDAGRPTEATAKHYTELWDSIGTPDNPGPEARRVLAFLRARDLSNFQPHGPAPMTAAKAAIAEANEPDLNGQLQAILEGRAGPFAFDMFTIADVMECVPRRTGDRDSGDGKAFEREVSAAVHTIGCRRISDVQVKIDGRARRMWAVSRKLAEQWAELSGPQLGVEYRRQRANAAPPSEFDA